MRATTVPIRNTRATAIRKKKSHLPQHIEFIVCAAVLVLLGATFMGYVQRSSNFRVQRVLFEGVHMLDEAYILEAADITVDDLVLSIDCEAVKARVESLPYVKHCEVKRMIPSEVLIKIVERRPNATIMVNNHLFEIDREFVVLRELSPLVLHTGPLITNLPGVFALEPGNQITIPELDQALELWEIFQTLPFSSELTLSELSAESTSSLRMFFEELPYEMRWGRSDFETQANRLAILWDEMDGLIPCEYYLDLRFDADLVCK